ncbi:MAG: hypothetical protein ACK5NG_00920 [Chthoniobacterales bacterium]
MSGSFLRYFVCFISIFALLFQLSEIALAHEDDPAHSCSTSTQTDSHPLSIDTPYSPDTTSTQSNTELPHHHCCTAGLHAETLSPQNFSSLNPSSKGLKAPHETSEAAFASSLFIPPRSLA